MAKDALSSLAGNRMGQLKSEIADLKAQLRKEFETVFRRLRRNMAKDDLSSLAGNRMGQLKSEIADLRAQLRKEFEPDKIAELKKLIREKETYYNILADRRRTGI